MIKIGTAVEIFILAYLPKPIRDKTPEFYPLDTNQYVPGTTYEQIPMELDKTLDLDEIVFI